MNQEIDMLRQFMKDKLCLHKADGRVIENILALVSGKGSLLIEDVRLPIEIGDKFTRKLPSGLVDEFIVDDPGYHEKFDPIAAHYQVKVHRAGTQGSAGYRGTTYNVSGSNARLNINSHDHSTNTIAFGDAQVFADLRKVLTESSIADGERAKLFAAIEAMANARGTTSFLDRYKDFTAMAANHMTIIAPFIPALTALLTGQ